MNLVTIEHLTKSYTERLIFDDTDFSINEGEKIGLIGINGHFFLVNKGGIYFIKNRGWFRGAGQGNRGARKKPGYALSAAEPEIYGG